MIKIGIIDYGRGNIRSVEKALKEIGDKTVLISRPADIKASDAIILPGVGAFKDCIESLRRLNLIDALYDIFESRVPFLGICLGMQILFSKSYEFGEHRGLGVIKGEVIKFKADVKVPHMGWNEVNKIKDSPLLKDIPPDTYFYFDHSYYVLPDEKVVIATTPYNRNFCSVIQKDNIFATQFHPEKSQKWGLQLLKNFYNFCRERC
jgi:glutamine amidotransferase